MGLFSKKRVVDLDFNTQLRERNQFTPDIAKLQEHCFQLLFVYDRMQQGFFEHEMLLAEHCVKAATAFTEEKFSMLNRPLGANTYPTILRRESWKRTPFKPRRIQGELYYVLSEQFRELDKVQKNGIEFNRELVDVYIPYTQLVKLPSVKDSLMSRTEYGVLFGTEHPSIHIPRYTTKKAYCYIGNDVYWEPFVETDEFMDAGTRYIAHDPKVGEYFAFKRRIDLPDDE